MLERPQPDTVVDAERTGTGRLPWAWFLYSEDTGAILSHSEPMFRTRSTALEVGERLQAVKAVRRRVERMH